MSIRIFGSGGGVITDATATPEDVKTGKVFYNNNGHQTGTATFRSTKQTIYTVKAGEISHTGGYTGRPFYVDPARIDDTYYLLYGNLKTSSMRGASPLYHLSVDIKCEDLEYIKFGSKIFKLIAGGKSDGTSDYIQFVVMSESVGTMAMKSPDGSYDVFPSIKFGYIRGRYDMYLTDIHLMYRGGANTTANTKYILAENIPIVISQYVD